MVEGAADRSGGVSFGPFQFLPTRQLLLEGEQPVRLGSRARDILLALTERPGQLVSKEELIARVWPNTFVEEGNLKVHIAALRRALGDGQAGNRYIANVPGRGYCFVAPVSHAADAEPNVAEPVIEERPSDLPAPAARMVGRSETVQTLAAQLPKRRFVTIVGPGGMGKTTVALAVAEGVMSAYADGVRFVDLTPLTDPQLVASALAAALGVAVRSENPARGLVSFLKDKRTLILLDNCEHVIGASATLAEALFRGTRDVHILATSREPLRADGEHVHRLAPLASPPTKAGITAAEALTFPAVQLFVERAAASLDDFEFSDELAPVVSDICRKLDGVALAIEIAAGRVDAFGVAGLANRLDDRFRLQMRGRRTAEPRHQTLRTTLDWSYALLEDFERIVLRRLAIFAGPFTMESACAVLDGNDASTSEIVDCIANLVAKSLVAASVDGAVAHYRLLDTTRAYALTMLAESGERERLARHHAEHHLALLEHAYAEWQKRPAAAWMEDHRRLLDNVRAALDWSFAATGDPAIGVGLAVAAVPFWFQSSLISECKDRVDAALSAPAAARTADQEMKLYAARAWSLMQTRGSVDETRTAWDNVLDIAIRLGDLDHQLRAIWGIWAGYLNSSEFRKGLALAERFCALAEQDPSRADLPVGDRMVGYILHLLGDQTAARQRIERMLRTYVPPTSGAQIIRFIFDQRATAQCFLARILWLQGFPDQALRIVEETFEETLASDDPLSLCQVLTQAACPVALLVGDLDRLQRFADMLLDNAVAHALDFWQAWGRCFSGALAVRRGDLAAGLRLLGAALGELREIGYGVYYIAFLGEFAQALGRAGRVPEGLSTIDEALDRSERNEARWYVAELLRIKGELVQRSRSADAAADAERHFQLSLDWARQQQTPSWELRSALSLAGLWREQGREIEAQALLAPIYGQFVEGFDTADLRAARQFLAPNA